MNELALAFARAAAGERSFGPSQTPRPAPGAPRWVRDDRFRHLIGIIVFLLVLLMIVPDGFNYADLTAAGAPTSGGLISRLLWLGLLGAGVTAVLWRAVFTRLLVQWLNPFLLVFVALALCSIVWSIDPSVSARRLIRVVTIVLCSLAFAVVSWHPRRFQNTLRPIITAVLLASLIFGLAWPALAIHQETTPELLGAWHGLANHKNGFGDIACIGVIFWAHGWLSRQVRLLPALLGGGLALCCLVLSRSSTSMVATVFTLLLLVLLLRSSRALQRYMPYLVGMFMSALVGYSLVVLNIVPGLSILMSPISAITGKDMSFTGRTEIWDIVSDHIALQPLFGSGYGAYWTGPAPESPSYEFMRLLNFYPGSAHNGYLEMLNDLGALGLLVLFAYLISFVRQSLRLLQTDRVQASLFLALFLQQAIVNLSESRWLSVFSVDFVIMTLATAALARALLEQGLRSHIGHPPATHPLIAPVADQSRRYAAQPPS